jgi:hypothetical protein
VYQGKVFIRPEGTGSVSDPAACDANPNCAKTLFVLDELTGQEGPSVQHSDAPVQHGAMTPPCVNRDGKLVIAYNGSWGLLDLSTRRIADAFIDSTGEGGVHNLDENENVTCSNSQAKLEERLLPARLTWMPESGP